MKIKKNYIPLGRHNRPQGVNLCKHITIHNTENYAPGATAAAHINYLNTTKDFASWHYTVDEGQVVQHLPDTERAFHAGDGNRGEGNCHSIGIEICVNGDFRKAHDRAAALVAQLIKRHGLSLDDVVQHNTWTGKDCPKELRRGKPYTWAVFIERIRDNMETKDSATKDKSTPSDWAKEAWDWAKARGITDGTNPRGTVTREQVALMIYRAMKGVK